MKFSAFYTQLARKAAKFTGQPIVFFLALGSVVLWLICGPVFGCSDTCQLVINTGTTIITFLMVLLIQNTQNSDTQAMQLKLDELIRVNKEAHHALMDLEELEEDKLGRFRDIYEKIAKRARVSVEQDLEDLAREATRDDQQEGPQDQGTSQA